MADLIERDKTIKEIDEHLAFVLQTYNKRYGNSDNEYIAGYKRAHEHIKGVITLKLPSEQPEPKWIPCSERLPVEKDAGILKILGKSKRSEYVLATVEVKGERMTVTACTCDGEWNWEMKYAFPDYKIIAWMPLPEPWRGETDG